MTDVEHITRVASDLRGALGGASVAAGANIVVVVRDEPIGENPGLSWGDVPAPNFTFGTGVGEGSTSADELNDAATEADAGGPVLDDVRSGEDGCEVGAVAEVFNPEAPYGSPVTGSRYQLTAGSPRHSPSVVSRYPRLRAWSIMYWANQETVCSWMSCSRDIQDEDAGLFCERVEV